MDGENFDFMFYKKRILPTVNDTAYGVRTKKLQRRAQINMVFINANRVHSR